MPHIDDMRKFIVLSNEKMLTESMLVEDKDNKILVEELVEEFNESENFYILCMEDAESARDTQILIMEDYGVWTDLLEPSFIKITTDDLSEMDFKELPGLEKVLTETHYMEEYGKDTSAKTEDLIEGLKSLVEKWSFIKENTGNDDINFGKEEAYLSAANDIEELLRKLSN